MSIFEGAIEALLQAVHSWEPENQAGDASAQKMRLALLDVPEFIGHVAEAFRIIEGKTVDKVLLEAGGADLMGRLAANMDSQVEPLREIAADMDRIHDQEVRHMTSDDPRAGSWDWRANQPDML